MPHLEEEVSASSAEEVECLISRIEEVACLISIEEVACLISRRRSHASSRWGGRIPLVDGEVAYLISRGR